MMGVTSRRTLLGLLLGTLAVGRTAAQSAPGTARALFLFLYRPGPAWIAGRPMAQQNLRSHGQYYSRLMQENRVFAGGGYVGEDGGMAIVRAATLEGARTILAADPAITGGVFVAEIRQWAPRFNSAQPLVETA